MLNESFVTRETFRNENFPGTKNSKEPPQYSSKVFHTILSGFAYLIAESDSFLNSRK